MKEITIPVIPPFRRKSSEISVPESSSSEKNGKKIQDRLLLKLNIKPHKNRKEHISRPTTLSPSIQPSFEYSPQQEQPPPLPSVDRLKSIVKRHSAPDISFNNINLSPSGKRIQVNEIPEELIYYELDKLDCTNNQNEINFKDPADKDSHSYRELEGVLKTGGSKLSNDQWGNKIGNNRFSNYIGDDKTNIFFDTTQAKLMIEIQERLKKRNILKADEETNAYEIKNLATDLATDSFDENSDYYSIPIDEIQKLKVSDDVAIEALYATVNKKKNVKTFENDITIEELYATVNKKNLRATVNNPAIEGLYATVNKKNINKSLDIDYKDSSDFTISESTWL
ncbi:uncharacterized protein LOC100198538 isoform X1 [Hydra vulgaris]|uniref:uncharacterized protein LOC100198538 isoform X1 n=1 Tax=Hydra vulgaris TaxID=6087 RepID=UPI001F5FAD27|nr:uncharacterized protein LOC100198538 [Hydra vulgaris]